jgi:sulfur carrier protein
MTATLAITLNGEPQTVVPQAVGSLLATLGISAQTGGVAVAINDAVIPRGRWGTHQLADGDNVEVVRATAGG